MDQGALGFETAFTINVLNVNEAPTSLPGGPYNALLNQIFNLAGDGTDPDAGQSLVYQWDLNYDGTRFDIEALGKSPTVTYSTPGTFTIGLRVTDNGTPSLSSLSTTTVTISAPPPKVTSVVFGDGSNNRSMVRSIDVAFDAKVTIDAGAFLLERRVNGAFAAIPSTELAIAFTDIGSVNNSIARLTFSGTGVIGQSLADGYYRLTIVATRVRASGVNLDGNGDSLPGGNYSNGVSATDKFFRLFGDTSGDGFVGLSEFGAARSTFGKLPADPGYNAAFDFDGRGVALSDFGQVRSRFGKPQLPW
jgi:hypothetical protein